MFFALIDEITLLQQARRKRVPQEEEDLNPPLTTDNLISARRTEKDTDRQTETEATDTKLNGTEVHEKKLKKYCCFG
jgi:hypothetical protein